MLMPKYGFCKYCGEVIKVMAFLPYCGVNCKDTMKRNHPEEYYAEKGRKPKTKICEECGESYETFNKTPYCSKECRSAVQRRKYFQKKQQSDFVIFERDGFRCVYCGKSSLIDGVKLEVEHIYPISRGGGDDLFNVATSCSKCNGEKSTRMMPDQNILDLWYEIEQRNERAGMEHYKELKERLALLLKSRRERLMSFKEN